MKSQTLPNARFAALLAGMAALLAGAGCLPGPQPSGVLVRGEPVLEESFSRANAWERYEDPRFDAVFAVEPDEGVYRARIGLPGLLWGLNSAVHTDVAIEVDTEQRSDADDNAYGVMCRASESNNGDGYYFLISGDGGYTIRRGAADSIPALVAWARHPAIQTGRAFNRIRAVCVGERLALFVNGQFIAETTDRRYQRGFTGLVAAATRDGAVDIAFDALTVWPAEWRAP